MSKEYQVNYTLTANEKNVVKAIEEVKRQLKMSNIIAAQNKKMLEDKTLAQTKYYETQNRLILQKEANWKANQQQKDIKAKEKILATELKLQKDHSKNIANELRRASIVTNREYHKQLSERKAILREERAVERRLEAERQAYASFANRAYVSVGLPTTIAAYKSIKNFAQFQDTEATAKYIFGNDFEKVSNAASIYSAQRGVGITDVMGTLSKSGLRLSGSGMSIDDVIGLSTAMMDAANAMNADLGRVSLAITQIVNKGSVRAEEYTNQLMEQNINPTKELAAVVGVSEKEILDRISDPKGKKPTAEQFVRAFIQYAKNQQGLLDSKTGTLAFQSKVWLSQMKQISTEYGGILEAQFQITEKIKDNNKFLIKSAGYLRKIREENGMGAGMVGLATTALTIGPLAMLALGQMGTMASLAKKAGGGNMLGRNALIAGGAIGTVGLVNTDFGKVKRDFEELDFMDALVKNMDLLVNASLALAGGLTAVNAAFLLLAGNPIIAAALGIGAVVGGASFLKAGLAKGVNIYDNRQLERAKADVQSLLQVSNQSYPEGDAMNAINEMIGTPYLANTTRRQVTEKDFSWAENMSPTRYKADYRYGQTPTNMSVPGQPNITVNIQNTTTPDGNIETKVQAPSPVKIKKDNVATVNL